ncbi:hypothetical protein ACHAWT_009962 [Skeletonema menzelii]|mmetsp:Transcript_10344/g.17063  ORF Transcript_10344/g.17063 Transcript_10344/m.17063 type:complete len:242 (-) Transcript_10344:434-1159(-)
MMHYGPREDHFHEHDGNKPPRMQQHHTFLTGKIDQSNSMADDWQADVHFFHRELKDEMPLSSVKFDIECTQASQIPVRPLSLSSVQFDLEKTSVLQYDAYGVDEEGRDGNDYSFSSSRSEELSFKTTTLRVIKACRQELLDAGEDVNASSNGRERRDCDINRLFDMDMKHLISSISIKKNLAQILARKQVVRAVLDEQARQRLCNRVDKTLIAMTSMEYSRYSVERARMIGFSNQRDVYWE